MSDLRAATVGVAGAGAMGSGIAQVAAAAGHAVVLADAMDGAAKRAHATIGTSLQKLVEKGKMTAAAREALLARITVVDRALGADVTPFKRCGFMIEAIVEDLGAKQALFAALSKAVAGDAVLATNTSSLSVASLARAAADPSRVIGVHFFNPAPVLPLVEIVPTLGTSDAVARDVRALVDAWGKTTVLASDTPGFIVNRVARPFYSEALRIHDEGLADSATIDWAMKTFGGFRMGPFELMDFIGHDVNFAVTTSMFASHFNEPRYTPSFTQKRLVDAGLLGKKTGRGFYAYDGLPMPAPREDLALGQAIADRIVAMLINEAADALFWRVASAADIDTAVMKGVNYPRGLLAWCDEIGAKAVVARLAALHEEYGDARYRVSPALWRLAARGGRFHG